MIPFQTWLSQILGYCRFVTDTVGLWRAWVNGDFSHTSVTGFDELYEQIFDDLDSDSIEIGAEYLAEDLAAREALSTFLNAVRSADKSREINLELISPENLLRSDEWNRVVKAAEKVKALFDGVE